MATQAQKIKAFAESKLGSRAYDNYCQRFVRECCEAGGIYGQAASADEAWRKWGKASDKSIPLCAAVYFDGTGSWAIYGHVGLYVGDGYVIHAWNGVRKEKLSELERKVTYRGWGYQGGAAPDGSVVSGAAGISGASDGAAVSESSGSSGGTHYDPSRELAELNSFLKRLDTQEPPEAIERAAEQSGELPELNVRVIINGDKATATEIPVLDDLTVTYERVGVPGKLTFSTLTEFESSVSEGDRVSVRVDGELLFVGYIFARRRGKDETVSITAYNQLRYLKNKDTRVYSEMTASELLRAIAADFNLETGYIEDTKLKLNRIEDNTALIDMLLNALEETFAATGEIYVLFDKEGRLTLKNVKSMKLESVLVCKDTAQDYTYKTGIDSDVYNQVKLVYDNEETGSYDAYITKDSASIERWGLLQYFEKIKSPLLGPVKSEALLKSYNRLARNLTIEGVLGSTDVIAGCLVPVLLDLGDIQVKNFMMVEKVTHKLKNKEYFMDLIVTGGDFVV